MRIPVYREKEDTANEQNNLANEINILKNKLIGYVSGSLMLIL